MRKILFRGKEVETGAWIYGYYTETCATYCIGQSVIEDENDDYLVIPETVGQFTRMCDSNHKMIFDGDILKVCKIPKYLDRDYDSFIGVVEDLRTVYQVIGEECDDTPWVYLHDLCRNYITIIGNIHDNLELLKEANK